jgi:type I restriction enzyme, S subunit
MATLTWSLKHTVLASDLRADPEFYDPRAESVRAALEEQGATALACWVSSASRGVGPEYEDEGTVRVIKTANVRRFMLAAIPSQFVSARFAHANERAQVRPGSLLVTATGVGSAGRTFVKLDDEPMIADAHVTVLPTVDLESAAFLCAYLQSPIGRQQLLQRRRGSSRQIEIYPQDIVSVLVPKLKPAERRSIGDRWLAAITAVAASADAVLDAQRRITAVVGELPAVRTDDRTWTQPLSVLKSARRIDPEFATPAIRRLRQALADGGAVPLAELLTSVRKGVQPEHYDEDGPVRVVKSKDVHFPELDLTLCERTTSDDLPYSLEGGEVLVNMTGQGTLGRATVVPVDAARDGALIPSVDVYALGVDRSMVLPEYLALFLNSPVGRILTESLQTGSSGQQHLYPVHFTQMPIPVPRTEFGDPDHAWQAEIVAIAEARNSALRDARHTAAELDAEFVQRLGVPVDLAIIPI